MNTFVLGSMVGFSLIYMGAWRDEKYVYIHEKCLSMTQSLILYQWPL